MVIKELFTDQNLHDLNYGPDMDPYSQVCFMHAHTWQCSSTDP